MPHEASQQAAINVVPTAERQQALWSLYARVPLRSRRKEVAATLAAAERRELSLDGLLGASRGSRLVGVVWGRILPGRTALVWPPQLAAGEDTQTAQRLLHRLNEYLQAGDVRLAQTLLSTDAAEDAARLRDAGYVYGADLLYMACLAERFPVHRPRSVLDLEPYSDGDRRRLAELIESTYADTRDLPLLNGARDINDVLDGYRQTGVFRNDRWLFVRHGRQDVGCLLLTDHPGEDQWELMYMGLTPSARGRGWGLQITQYGLWLAAQSGRTRVLLAVDALNQPAVSVYEAAGFLAWDRRSVYLEFF